MKTICRCLFFYASGRRRRRREEEEEECHCIIGELVFLRGRIRHPLAEGGTEEHSVSTLSIPTPLHLYTYPLTLGSLSFQDAYDVPFTV
jgi:hypothetical protein